MMMGGELNGAALGKNVLEHRFNHITLLGPTAQSKTYFLDCHSKSPTISPHPPPTTSILQSGLFLPRASGRRAQPAHSPARACPSTSRWEALSSFLERFQSPPPDALGQD